MCDIDGDLVGLPVDYAPLDDGEAVWTEADHEAFTEWAAACDSELQRAPTVEEILAEAESGPVTSSMIAAVKTLDVSMLDDDQAVSFSRCWQRIVSHGQAQMVAGVARVVRTYRSNPMFDGVEGAARELESALRLGPRQTGELVTTSLDLTSRLGATWDELNAGQVSWANADYLAHATAGLDDDKARAVEAVVLPRAGERTSSQHRDAVRRAVDRIDPEGIDERRQKAQRTIRLIRSHYGDGMGQLFADMPSEHVDVCFTAADAWARQHKAAGDPRTLDQLRCAAMVGWATSFLFHGDGSHCDRHCTHPKPTAPGPAESAESAESALMPDDPDENDADEDDPGPDEPGDDPWGGDGGGPPADPPPPADPSPPAASPPPPSPPSRPSRQGRAVELDAIWDLASLLGVTNSCGELLDSGAVLPPSSMRELVAGGVRLRRMVIDPDTGELLDLTPGSWFLPATRAGAHRQPVCLKVIVTKPTADALLAGRCDALDPALVAAVQAAHPSIRAMLAAPLTADELDARPHDERPSPALSEFIATRDRYPTNPTAGPSPAKAADGEHTISRRHGGKTVRDNLTSVVRRWHNGKTHGHWTTRKINRDWTWTSPLGRTYTTRPFDYRLGP
jgi:hypothetical protein